MQQYWIYFQGTSNGAVINAKTMKQAKFIFAESQGINSIARIKGTKRIEKCYI
tara:strand:- start:1550 stop:1708 length:159 start_codon:yes stop_codon:yes gene_type:complete